MSVGLTREEYEEEIAHVYDDAYKQAIVDMIIHLEGLLKGRDEQPT